MKSINLAAIIESCDLDEKEVAKKLFPDNKFPKMALKRILSGDALLDSEQLSKLSLMTGIPISKLYEGGNWSKMKSNPKGVHTFTSGNFTAELDTKTWITKVFHNKSLFHESVIHSGTTALSVYLNELNSIINKYENDE